MILTRELLKGREFISLATADKSAKPNAAPKFLLKYEKPYMYLVDYSFATTTANLRVNPRAALSFMDLDNLEGYRVSGTAELIEKGKEFAELAKEIERKNIQLSTDRVLEGMRTGKKYNHFALERPDKFVVIKFKVEEVTRIGTRGDFYREKE